MTDPKMRKAGPSAWVYEKPEDVPIREAEEAMGIPMRAYELRDFFMGKPVLDEVPEPVKCPSSTEVIVADGERWPKKLRHVIEPDIFESTKCGECRILGTKCPNEREVNLGKQLQVLRNRCSNQRNELATLQDKYNSKPSIAEYEHMREMEVEHGTKLAEANGRIRELGELLECARGDVYEYQRLYDEQRSCANSYATQGAELDCELSDCRQQLKTTTEDRDEYQAKCLGLFGSGPCTRQDQLDHHAAEVRRLMGLPPQSPWKSQVASESDYEEGNENND